MKSSERFWIKNVKSTERIHCPDFLYKLMSKAAQGKHRICAQFGIPEHYLGELNRLVRL